MDIKALKIEDVDGGYILTVSAFLPSCEPLDGTEIGVLKDLLKETAARTRLNEPPVVSRDTDDSDPQAAMAAASRDAEQADPPEGTRRRRRTQGSEIEGTIATSAEPSRSEPEADATPATGSRRRRRTEAQLEAEANPSPDTSSGRRRNTGADANTASPGPASVEEKSDISDRDLMKAASAAAADFGREAVQPFLTLLSVKSVSELKGGDRQKFLDLLAKLRED
jgi:hypothetical protein